jgi:hypothetical protein
VRPPRKAVSGAWYKTVRAGITRIGIAVITAPFQSFRHTTGSPGLSTLVHRGARWPPGAVYTRHVCAPTSMDSADTQPA